VGQDISQIAEKYGDKAADTIIANTAAKVILRVNEPATAERFTNMMGKKKTKKKEKGPDGKETEVTKEEDLFTPMDLMTLPMGKQIILYQGHYNRPIEADGEWHFYRKNKIQIEMDDKVQMGEATPIPEFLVAKHHRALRYAGAPRVYDPQTKQIKELAQ
jgi:type IV secretory pathway TraG/TraD family ATPase VirD4